MERDTSVRQLDGADSEWQYRGRSNSEHAELEPISAPTGLPAQKNEGFQRFYKAVVSPTHVRVTAGGRIVPNTRGCSSPTGKWNRDKVVTDTGSANRDTAHAAHPYSGVPIQMSGYATLPPIFHTFSPAISPGLPPDAMFSWAGWPFGFGVCAPFPSPVMPPSTDGMAMSQNNPTTIEMDTNNPKLRSNSLQAGRLDIHSYHGPGLPFMESKIGSALPKEKPLLQHPLVAPNLIKSPSIQRTLEIEPVESLLSTTEKDTTPSKPEATLSSPENSRPSKESIPPISSIRPSQITKKQIDVLRSSLRYLEDQLQYNKHQIDEKLIEHQAKMVCQQIQQFEQNFEAQRIFEESHYPKEEKLKETISSSDLSKKPAPSIKPSQRSERDQPETVSLVQSRRHELGVSSTDHSIPRNRRSSSKESTVAEKGEPEVRSAPAARKYSTLPSKAAMAPPFRPQAGQVWQSTAEESFENNTDQIVGLDLIKGDLAEHGNYQRAMMPYLVGHLPSNFTPPILPHYQYKYDRELTEGELRARHMYWGNSPHNLPSVMQSFDSQGYYAWCKPTVEAHGSLANDDAVKARSLTAKREVDSVDTFKRPRHGVNIAHLEATTQSEYLPARDSSATDISSIPSPKADSCMASVLDLSNETSGTGDGSIGKGGIESLETGGATVVPNIRRKVATARYVYESTCNSKS